MTVTKACIVDRINNETRMSKKRSAQLLDTLLETMKQTLASGEDILIRGVGKFTVRTNHGHRGKGVATGGDQFLETRRVVSFKCAPLLKRKMNGEYQD